MNHKQKIQLNDTVMDMMVKMSEGNPGALTTCMELIKTKNRVDPDAFMGGIGNILDLDRMGIYGTDIYVLWSDICDRNIAKMITILRASQLGFISDKIIADASHYQDYSGKGMIDVEDLYKKVKERLPNFDPDNETGITIPAKEETSKV